MKGLAPGKGVSTGRSTRSHFGTRLLLLSIVFSSSRMSAWSYDDWKWWWEWKYRDSPDIQEDIKTAWRGGPGTQVLDSHPYAGWPAGQGQGQGLGLRANRRGGGCQKRESELGAWASLTKGVPRRRRPRTGIPRRWTSFPAFGGRFRARGGGSGGGPGGAQTLYNYIFFIDVQTSTTYPYTSVPRPL